MSSQRVGISAPRLRRVKRLERHHRSPPLLNAPALLGVVAFAWSLHQRNQRRSPRARAANRSPGLMVWQIHFAALRGERPEHFQNFVIEKLTSTANVTRCAPH